MTQGLGAVTLTSKIADLFIYCTTENFDADYASRFGNGCVRIGRPEEFFLALDAGLRGAVSAAGLTVGPPLWGRCVYEGRMHDWERENVPDPWLLKPARYQGQHEIRVHWQTLPIQPLMSIVLKVPSIITHCTLP